MLAASLATLQLCPDGYTPMDWSFSRHAWQLILLDRDALAGGLAFTSDSEHPTLHGLPVTVERDRVDGYALNMMQGRPA